MKIERENNGKDNCMVMPLMDIGKFRESEYYVFLTKNDLVDFVFIEDSSKDFCFSKSMNSGIKEALNLGYKYITLSTDNNSWNQSDRQILIDYMKNKLSSGYYISLRVNGHKNIEMITDSVIRDLVGGVLKVAPIFTLRREMLMRKSDLPNFYTIKAISYHSGFPGIMPFSIFSSNILEAYKFDENIKNSFEDTDLSYRLHRGKIPFHRIPIDTIHRGNQSFRKINSRNPLSGYYNIDDWSNNVRYLYAKYFSASQPSDSKESGRP